MPRHLHYGLLACAVLACSAAVPASNKDYAVFLKDVARLETASGVFLLENDEELRDGFSRRSRLADLVKRLSGSGVLSQAIDWSRLACMSSDSLYDGRNRQVLFAAALASSAELKGYQLASSAGPIANMSRGFWALSLSEAAAEEACEPAEPTDLGLVFDTKLSVQCDKDERVRRWYGLNYGRTESIVIARWQLERGLHDYNPRYYDERHELRNKSLKIGTVKLPEKLTETSGRYEKNSRLARYFTDVLAELQSCMNFSVRRIQEEDEVSKWTNLLESVTDGRADLVVAPITLSKHRLEFIDYSKPLLLSKNRIYLKQPDGVSVQWSAYFRTFTRTTWSLIGLMLIGASLTTAFIRAIIQEATFLRVSMHYILENFISVWGVYCQQGISDPPSATPLRLAYFTTLLLTFVLWAIYSASITSYLTIQSPSLPFSNIEGLVKEASYRIIVLQNSSDQENIMAAKDPTLAKLRPLMLRPKQLPTNPFAAFQQVCAGRIGFYASEAVLNDVSDSVPCRLTFIDTGHFECLSMVLTKGSPYVTSISYNLQRLEDSGVLKRLKYRYFRKLENPPEMTHPPVGFWSVIPLLVIYLSGVGLSLFIFAIERLCQRRRLDAEDGSIDSLSSLPL